MFNIFFSIFTTVVFFTMFLTRLKVTGLLPCNMGVGLDLARLLNKKVLQKVERKIKSIVFLHTRTKYWNPGSLKCFFLNIASC